MKMSKVKLIWVVAMGLAWSGICAEAQTRAIQPSPAYYQGGAYTRSAAEPAQVVAPAPVQQPAYRYEPQPQLTLAPATAYEEEEDFEEGIYWPWGQKWPGLALGPKIGTTGIGLDLIFGVNPYLNLRSGVNFGSFTLNSKLGDVEYDMDLDLVSIPLLIDLHPFGNHFRITGGAYIQPGNKAQLNATPSTPVQIGEHLYPTEVVGTLSGEAKFSNVVAPYLGIGFGNAVDEDQMLTFMVDFGVIFQSYEVSLTSNGAGMETPVDTFRVDLAKEEENVQSDLDSFKIYPVLTFGVAYHF